MGMYRLEVHEYLVGKIIEIESDNYEKAIDLWLELGDDAGKIIDSGEYEDREVDFVEVRCPQCKEFFDPRDSSRNNSKFCSDNCMFNAYEGV